MRSPCALCSLLLCPCVPLSLCCSVYIGSFWDGECSNPDMAPMFRAEQADLLRDLHEVGRVAVQAQSLAHIHRLLRAAVLDLNCLSTALLPQPRSVCRARCRITVRPVIGCSTELACPALSP